MSTKGLRKEQPHQALKHNSGYTMPIQHSIRQETRRQGKSPKTVHYGEETWLKCALISAGRDRQTTE
ncbi:hypothetical protein GQ600_23830 [Phytophthora cactorum]|nr:hypothetical protein GQ600_23830 [Phytophthora cactorum]